MRKDVIVALRMNGEALRPEHGAPARLVVPGWYAVASVKWLLSVRLLERRFTGWFQRRRYVWDDGSPVTTLRSKTLILHPTHGARIQAGPVNVEGRAWGEAGVAEVQVRIDDGPCRAAELKDLADPHAWRAWSTLLELPPGAHTITARARNTRGRWQPLEPTANRLGYGYNTAHTVPVEAGGQSDDDGSSAAPNAG
jgi:sulfane dehydrogenase subunit SoxC